MKIPGQLSVAINKQMTWSPDAAHNLLQVRTAVLNDDLKASFDQWYPKAA